MWGYGFIRISETGAVAEKEDVLQKIFYEKE